MATGLTGLSSSATMLPGQSSPGDSGGWVHGHLAQSFFPENNMDPSMTLTAEEQRIFDALGDDSGFAESLLSECPNDKEVILAAAQAAGLHKGGIRRTAFSMGDLQALQPPGPPSPSDDSSGRELHMTSSGGQLPKLESVPENQPSTVYKSAGAHPTHQASSIRPRSSLEQHRMEIMSVDGNNAEMHHPFDMPGSLFTGGQPTEEALPPSQMGVSEAHTQSDASQALNTVPDLFDFYGAQDSAAAGPVHSSAASTAPDAPTEEVKMLQGFAETLLKQQQQQQHHQKEQQQRQEQEKQRQQQQAAAGQQKHSTARPPPGPSSAAASQAQAPAPAPSATLSPASFPARERGPTLGLCRSSEERERNLRRSQSAIELRSLGGGDLPRQGSDADLKHYEHVGVELTTPEGHTYHVGRLSTEDRAQKILRYRQKRHERNFSKRIKYQCRKTLADSRPRVRGRFARNNDAGAVMPHETKKAQAERARRRGSGPPDAPHIKQEVFPGGLDEELDVYGSFASDDLLPASDLPLSDLPTLPELGPLMASPGSVGMPMQGLSEGPEASGSLSFADLSGPHASNASYMPGMLDHFATAPMRQTDYAAAQTQLSRFRSSGSSEGAFTFGSDFIPNDLLSRGGG